MMGLWASWSVWSLLCATVASSPAAGPVRYGIDRLVEPAVAELLADRKLAVLTHAAAVDAEGTHLLTLLRDRFDLRRVLAPEHGFAASADAWVADSVDAPSGLEVRSLYKPGATGADLSVLEGIDTVVVDLQDVGMRHYTYVATLVHVMRTAASLGVGVVVLDRPNLLGGAVMEGPVLAEALAHGLAAYATVPTRHGMTLGELAVMIDAEAHLQTQLVVVDVLGWRGERVLFETHHPFVAPSPALTTREQVGLYALWGALETFNLTVGRGADNGCAFRVIGAPWMTPKDAQALADALGALHEPHVVFRPCSWRVSRAVFVGQTANGVYVQWNGHDLRTDRFIYEVGQTLMRLFADRLVVPTYAASHFGSQAMLDAMAQQVPWADHGACIDAELARFATRRAPYLRSARGDRCP